MFLVMPAIVSFFDNRAEISKRAKVSENLQAKSLRTFDIFLRVPQNRLWAKGYNDMRKVICAAAVLGIFASRAVFASNLDTRCGTLTCMGRGDDGACEVNLSVTEDPAPIKLSLSG